MEEAQCDKLIAYFVEASKRKFLETKQTFIIFFILIEIIYLCWIN
ncbi:hypothetical protein [Paulownia witches'-broom phytoplasma]|nr:hypothetical protein [Paulownia witches'-broom phytoplasma]